MGLERVMETNIIYCGDCLLKLKDIPDETIDLIYIDPPFSSNRNYVAFWKEQEKRRFEDRFENIGAYLNYMYPRIKELHRVLKNTGSFYYHCDWHASHHIKVLLDRDDLFGYSNFRNEIVWHYKTFVGQVKRYFPKKHDTILFYTKSNRWTFNQLFDDDYKDTIDYDRWNRYLTEGNKIVGANMPMQDTRFTRYYRRWVRQHGHEPRPNDVVYELKGQPLDTVWDIKAVDPKDRNRLGYPTQKPPKLLEKIILSSSNQADIVLDAFCGCGTTLFEAQKNKRKWIGIDISPTACRVIANHLQKECNLKEGVDFYIRDLPKSIEELREYPPFEFQNWAVNALGGIPSKSKVRDGGIDGKLYPIEIKKEKKEGLDLFGDIDRYIPIQVKRTDQVGQPDIENFEVAMKRDKRNKGIFVGFDFSRDANKEIRRVEREEGLEIETVTVADILDRQLDKQLR